jgi:hypothetical protein
MSACVGTLARPFAHNPFHRRTHCSAANMPLAKSRLARCASAPLPYRKTNVSHCPRSSPVCGDRWAKAARGPRTYTLADTARLGRPVCGLRTGTTSPGTRSSNHFSNIYSSAALLGVSHDLAAGSETQPARDHAARGRARARDDVRCGSGRPRTASYRGLSALCSEPSCRRPTPSRSSPARGA